MARQRSIWERLVRESSEGPTVTLTLPREVAQELMGILMGSLEMDLGGAGGGEDEIDVGMSGGEPDADDFGGPSDGDADDMFGVDDLEAEPDDDSDDDDETDESAGPAYGRPSPRTTTALGERLRRTRRR